MENTLVPSSFTVITFPFPLVGNYKEILWALHCVSLVGFPQKSVGLYEDYSSQKFPTCGIPHAVSSSSSKLPFKCLW